MNILYLIDNPQLYGSEMHLLDILTYMTAKNKIFLISFRTGPLINKVNKVSNVQIDIIPSGYIITKRILNKIIDIVKTESIQVIHAHQPKAIFIGAFVKKRCNISLVSTIHSQPIDHALIYKGVRRLVVFFFHSFISYFGQALSDKNIFVSQAMLGNANFPERSELIYNWLRPSLEVPTVIEKHLQNKEKITFVYCGAVTYPKGADILLNFVQKMLEVNIKKFKIKVAGGVDEKFWNDLKNSYSSEILDRIELLGYIDNITSVYLSADFFVLFSRSETFGLVCVEGMAFGLPVIVSDLPVFHEIIPSMNCVSNNLDDAVRFVLSLLADTEKYNNISQRNQKWVFEKFSFKESMKRLESIYKELI